MVPRHFRLAGLLPLTALPPSTVLLLPFLAVLCAGVAAAQAGPVAGSRFELTYHPSPAGPLAEAAALEVVYAFNAWGTREGTRLALLENVLRPDTMRVRSVDLRQTTLGWKAAIDIPANASLLSYYVTDGTRRDDNNERTYVLLVRGADGRPVRNAHFRNVPFLALARESLERRIAEAEEEVRLYPDNFQAWYLVFSLQFEQEKGSPRAFQRITERLEALERVHRDDQEFLNLAAQTWFYILRDTEKALEVRKRIGVPNQWPDVLRMYDRETVQETQRRAAIELEQRRIKLLDAPIPDITLMGFDGRERRVRADSGQVILLVAWASSSERSRELLDELARVHMANAGRGLRIVAVSLDPDEQAARGYVAERALPFEQRLNMGVYLRQLGVDSVPQTFIIDRGCILRRIILGYGSETSGELADALKALL
jgi:hypothetical protein